MNVYLVLLIATWAAHFALVGFVVVGSAWVLVRHLRGGDDPVAAVTRDWLPFALGMAITFGVAPLLFIQVLYQPRFYTATLLMSHRFMAIVPALIVGFYLLYASKTARVAGWSRPRRVAVAAGALGSFLFVGWSWVEAHVLATELDQQVWVDHFREGRWFHRDPVIARRLLMWVGLASAAFAAGAGPLAAARASTADLRRLGLLGIAGVVATIGAARWLDAPLPASSVAWQYAAAAAAVAALAGFALLALGRARAGRWLAAGGTTALLLAIAVLREASRAVFLGIQPTAAGAQGRELFFGFLIAGVVAIVTCVRIVRKHLATRVEPVP